MIEYIQNDNKTFDKGVYSLWKITINIKIIRKKEVVNVFSVYINALNVALKMFLLRINRNLKLTVRRIIIPLL